MVASIISVLVTLHTFLIGKRHDIKYSILALGENFKDVWLPAQPSMPFGPYHNTIITHICYPFASYLR